MRKLLVAILMLAMLMPSLACAMPICADEAQTVAVEQPCAGHSGHHDSGERKEPVDKVGFLKDCMDVDLQVADGAASVKVPDLKKDLSFQGSFAAYPVKIWAAAAIEIRGPPSNWPELSQTQPSLILTTQRFRI